VCATYTFAAPVIPEQVAYTTRTITVPSTLSSVADINFKFPTHSYLSDVEMEVISAQGTTVKLFERSCSNTNSTLMLSYDDSGADLACAATSLQTVVPFKH
jgi:hypothetical protein